MRWKFHKVFPSHFFPTDNKPRTEQQIAWIVNKTHPNQAGTVFYTCMTSEKEISSCSLETLGEGQMSPLSPRQRPFTDGKQSWAARELEVPYGIHKSTCSRLSKCLSLEQCSSSNEAGSKHKAMRDNQDFLQHDACLEQEHWLRSRALSHY